jgi:putative flippase GtrA
MSGSATTARKHGLSHATTQCQVLRFLVVGGANTLATTIAFYLLAGVLPACVAFTIVYVAGLTFVMLVTPGF